MKKIYFLLLTVLMTMTSFGQVFITELADPNDNADARYIELYNAGATAVDLSTWRIDKYTNASATVSQTLALTGTIPAGGFYIIATGPEDSVFLDTYGFAPNQWDPASNDVAGSNGDDNLELYDGATLVDQFGVPGEDGTGTCHEFEDGRAERKASVTSGNPTWDESEWNVWADSTVSGCTSHVGTPQDTVNFDPGSWIGTATGPLITVGADVAGLDYFEGNGPSAEDSFSVGGVNLSTDITVTAPSNFEVSLTSGSGFTTFVTVPTDGTGVAASTIVYVRLASGLTPATYTGNATASAVGASDGVVALSGTVSAANPLVTVTAFVNALNYSVGSGPSNEDSFSVEGLFLTNDIVVTAPTSFEVSLTSGSGFASSVSITPDGTGAIASTDVFVRLAAGLPVNSYAGDVTVASTGTTDQTVALSGNVFGAATNSLVLTAVFDGPLGGGTPKGVEIYVLQNVADLSLYGLGSANNGGGTDGQEFTFPAVSASAGDFIYVASEAVEFANFFGFAPDYTASGPMGINGDDAVELFENGVVIDTFGDINVDGTGEAWEYTDGWAYRVSDTGPDGGFVIANWSFSGIDALDGETTNAAAVTPVPVGSYSNTLSTDSFTSTTFNVYPNPSTNGFVNISSPSAEAISVNVYDVLGKNVLNHTISNNSLNVSSLNSGLYILRITQNGNSVTKKLVIK
ncbi:MULTISPECIES: lamin tail domain-containing protein [unclassified Bizionia]|uniref:lamin tail domain-containing protein n=1 Tax=unclassified Bizionia TaxID=2626393 RepID=UPI002051DCE9|nr:lamin tail domain-containing protein [Bizionia sp. M204]UPS92266.1 T9SS type A sorting domain-containing protein [Bizionia sp. M204]